MRREWEVALGAAVAGLGLLLLLVVIPREVRVIASETGEVSPAFFPRILAWAFILLGLVHALSSVAQTFAQGPATAATGDGTVRPALTRPLMLFAMMVVYLLLLPGIGFLPATALAMVAFIMFLGEGPLWRAVAVALPFAWCLELVFSDLLKTPLPRAGWLE
ncbi:MAG: tripartite tricarboxylate transporter TctB family protein [Hyphomicrobiaceae bacterium]